MKRSKIAGILFVLCAYTCYAQISVNADPRDVSRKKEIDDVRYRFTYRTSFAEDTLGKARYRDNQALEIGKSRLRYYSLFAETMDSTQFRHATGQRKGSSFSLKEDLNPGEVGQYEDLFIDLQTAEMTVFDGIEKKTYRYSEPAPVIGWTLTGRSGEVLGYACHEAVADFRGRTWHAWFAYDIPLRYGPWKLGGLPGLILKAEDADGLFTYELIGMEQPAGEKMYRYEIPSISCKREDILKINDLRWKDPEKHATSNGRSGFVSLRLDPVSGKMQKMTAAEYAASMPYIPQRELE